MEDVFAELLLTDPEDEKPEMTSREARIARAFADSKQSYASEIVVTPPGWFQVGSVQTDDLTKLDARNIEWSVQRLYLQRSYAAALQLAIEVLRVSDVELDSTIGRPLPENDNANSGTLPKNEARDREMLDVAIRCTLKLGDRDTAVKLAEASRGRWTNCPGLGYTAGEAFMFGGRSSDAISALLHAVRARTPSHPVLSLLAQSLRTSAKESTSQAAPLDELANIIGQYAERTKPAFDKGLFPETQAPLNQAKTAPAHDSKPAPKSKAYVPPETTVRSWAVEAGLSEVDVGLMVALCCTGDGGEEGTGERSVRSL